LEDLQGDASITYIKMDIREIVVRYMKIAQNGVQLRALTLTVLNTRVYYQTVRQVLLS
jgi:hypothetical protein